METIFENISSNLFNDFDFSFCLVVNILTYMIVNTFTTFKKQLTTWNKRVILLISVVVLGVVYYFTGAEIKVIINSSILAPISWSWIFKPICNKLGIDYKQLNNKKDGEE